LSPRAPGEKGKVISLALNFDNNDAGREKQVPVDGRINPVHTMLRTGTDAYSGVLDHRGIRAADDMVVMPLQCGTQWMAWGTCSTRTPCGTATIAARSPRAARRSAASIRPRTHGGARSVSRCPARARMDILPDGHAITSAELDLTAKKQNVQFKRATSSSFAPDRWKRSSPQEAGTATRAGRAGLLLRDARVDQAHRARRARLDTWAAKWSQRDRAGINQPWHWITIPIMGMTMARLLREGARRGLCADKTYEFLFVAPAIPITEQWAPRRIRSRSSERRKAVILSEAKDL